MRLAARLRQRRHTPEPRTPRSPQCEEPGTSTPETFELPELQHRQGGESPSATTDTSHEDSDTTREPVESVCTRQSSRNKTVLGAFWTTHVSIVVQPEASRDHLGMLPPSPFPSLAFKRRASPPVVSIASGIRIRYSRGQSWIRCQKQHIWPL